MSSVPNLDFDVIDERTRQLDMMEDRAADAHYDSVNKKLVVNLKSGVDVAIPVSLIEGLRQATDVERAKMMVTASGHGLHWDDIDVQLSVQGLLKGLYGSPSWMERDLAAAALGRKGGRSRTPAKAAAARKNGAKGGRPKSNAGQRKKIVA